MRPTLRRPEKPAGGGVRPTLKQPREATRRRWHEANPEYARWQSHSWREANLEKAAREAAYRGLPIARPDLPTQDYKASQKEAKRLHAVEATFALGYVPLPPL